MNNRELRQTLRERKEKLQIRQAFWLDMLGLAVPLAAPLVPAYLTATAIIEHYPALLHIDKGWVIAMAFIAGAVIEVLGILSIETMFDMRTFNATAAEGDEKAPFEWAAGAVGFYLFLVITLVMLLKIWSNLALWSLAPLTVLGFVTSWVMVLRKQHTERVFKAETLNDEQSEIERLNDALEQSRLNTERLNVEHQAALAREREQRLNVEAELNGLREKLDRMAEQAITKAPVKPSKKKAQAPKVDPGKIEQYFRLNPSASIRKAADELGYSIGSISQYRPIAHTNGHSKEVAL